MKLTSLLILFLITTMLRAGDTLDHQVFLSEINNSNDLIYRSCLQKYDEYLADHPGDVSVHIERCKFIQFAQYDDQDEYNPNQEAFDSCVAELAIQFPDEPEVILFQLTYLWGDDLKIVLGHGEASIEIHPHTWNNTQKGLLYKRFSEYYSSESDTSKALSYIEKAIEVDSIYKSSLDYARILLKSGRKSDALQALKAGADTTRITWELSRKADLYLELDDYQDALEIYNRINEIDSAYNDNAKIAETLEGIGQFEEARKYLVADTATTWHKRNSAKNLFLHDLKYESGKTCLKSYNQFRDFGYSTDPLGIFRLKLFLLHPLEAWKIRDLLGLVTLRIIILIILIIPFLWILPLYFFGHYFNQVNKPKAYSLNWGLKALYVVSAGYLLASFFPFCTNPEYLYSLFMSSFEDMELTQEKLGAITLIFVLLSAVVGFSMLIKKNPKILLSDQWTVKQSILNSIGLFILFKIVIGIYFTFIMTQFGLSRDELLGMMSHFMASKKEITSLIAVCGKGLGIILICLVIPVYEEIVFRGVILDACQRQLNFRTANAIQAILFATAHMNLYLFPTFLLFGIIAGSLRKKSGGLLGGIVFHVINNILAIAIYLVK